ncbi:MAG TPA: radical SAM family heme chaperone HemW [Polyangiaceae bacterium]
MSAHTTGASAPLGIYVHFPWCVRKCPYCDFLSLAIDPAHIPHDAYLERVLVELDARSDEVIGERRLRSVFIGGGTPSLWDPAAIGRLLEAIVRRFPSDPELEITAECNPSSFDAARAQALAKAGVNRVSIGVQSLDSERLGFLGRWHSPDEGLAAVRAALDSEIARVSADLIYGVHGQTPAAAVAEAVRVARTGVTHLSAYTLTIEKGTQFGARAQKGTLPLLPDDTVAESFLEVHAALADEGFEHYEISNFARGGHYAAHNIGYWQGDEYLGLGAGAWGTLVTAQGRVRYRNTPSPERYLDTSVAFGPLATDHERGLVQQLEPIDAETALRERLLLGLRLGRGVDIGAMAAELGVDAWPRERRRAADRLIARGRLLEVGTTLTIPPSQWLLADDTIASLL